MKRLENEANLQGTISRWILQIGNGISAIEQGSFGRLIQGTQHLQQRRFPAAAGAGNSQKLALGDAKIHSTQSLHLTVVEPFCDPDGLKNGSVHCGVAFSH